LTPESRVVKSSEYMPSWPAPFWNLRERHHIFARAVSAPRAIRGKKHALTDNKQAISFIKDS
jgi:hypothetical protein